MLCRMEWRQFRKHLFGSCCFGKNSRKHLFPSFQLRKFGTFANMLFLNDIFCVARPCMYSSSSENYFIQGNIQTDERFKIRNRFGNI